MCLTGCGHGALNERGCGPHRNDEVTGGFLRHLTKPVNLPTRKFLGTKILSLAEAS